VYPSPGASPSIQTICSVAGIWGFCASSPSSRSRPWTKSTFEPLSRAMYAACSGSSVG